MKHLILLLALCLSSNACRYKGESQPFETTVTVLDMDGNPVKGRTVKAFADNSQFSGALSSSNRLKASATTDAKGQVVLAYNLDISDSSQEFAIIAADDDGVFKCTNVVKHNYQSAKGTIKLTGTIKMDSLVPFKIRFKTNRDDVKALIVLINNAPSTPTDDVINTVFLKNTISTTTPKIDTIISTKVYSKASFTMFNGMNFKNAPEFIIKDRTLVTSFDNRNTFYLQEF
jgi:hypothetical protein